MIERLRVLVPAGFAMTMASVPLFPGFITLTAVAFPGVSVVPLPIALAVLAAMGLLGIYAVVMLIALPREAQPLTRPILIWWLAGCVATALGFDPRDGAIFLGVLGLGILWHISVMRMYAWRHAARAIWWSYAISGVVACVLAIGMALTHIPAAQYTIQHGRAVGTFVLPGELAGYLLFFVPIAYALARVARIGALRLLGWIGAIVGVCAMALTFSRTGWVGLATVFAAFVLFNARSRRRGLVVGGAIVLAALVLVIALFNEHHNPSENYTRISIWQAALGSFERFPLTGVGLFGFSHIYPALRLPDGDATAFHAHSMYFTFLVEGGIVGLAAFAWMLASFAREFRHRLTHADPPARFFATAIAAGLTGALVQGLIDTVSVVIFGLLLPMLALALVAARAGTGDA